MASKQENYYFLSFINLVDYSCKAAYFLRDIIQKFDYDSMEAKKDKIHLIEHAADEEKHKVTERLVKEFIPPIDREDILNIIRDIDDVTDAIEDIALRLYMYNVKEIRPEVSAFLDIICSCCEALKKLMEEFVFFRKSKNLKQLIADVLRLEEKCDVIYTKSVRNLFVNEKDPILITVWEDLFIRLENCCDACGEVSSTVETAYMKNL
jgi:predicted phosphate transport protein (TIGR00153 family)